MKIVHCRKYSKFNPYFRRGSETDLNEFISLSKSASIRPVTSTVNYRRPTIYQIYSTNLISFLANVFM